MQKTKLSAAEIITNRVIENLEEALTNPDKKTLPWRQAWKGNALLPKNLVSNNTYSGVNFFLLSMIPFPSPYYLTFKQVVKMGGKIKKGASSVPITFYTLKDTKKLDKNGEPIKKPILRYYKVFNLSDIEGIEDPSDAFIMINNDFSPIQKAESLLKLIEPKHAPVIEQKSVSAFYSITKDQITVPHRTQYEKGDEGEFYSTLFHEIGHSVGAEDRLNRETLLGKSKNGQVTGDLKQHTQGELYSREELTAELTSAMLCAFCGIDNTLENSTSYIKGWLKSLKDDSRFFFQACSDAQKTVNYLLGDNDPEFLFL